MFANQGQNNQSSQSGVPRSNVGGLLIVLGIFLWYLSDGLVKLSNHHNMVTVILYAVFFRGLALFIAQSYLARRYQNIPSFGESFSHRHAKIGMIGGALGAVITVCILMAEQYLPLMQVVMVLLTFPFFVLLLAPFALKLRISIRALLAVILGFAGVSLTMNPHTVGDETIVASISTIAESGLFGSFLSSFHPIYALKSEILVAYDWAFLGSLLTAVLIVMLLKRRNNYQAIALAPSVVSYAVLPLILLVIANVMGYTDSYLLDFAMLSWGETALLILAIATGFISIGVWHVGFVKNNFAFGGMLTYSGFIWAGMIDYLLFDVQVSITTIVGMFVMTGAGIWGGQCLYNKNKDRLT